MCVNDLLWVLLSTTVSPTLTLAIRLCSEFPLKDLAPGRRILQRPAHSNTNQIVTHSDQWKQMHCPGVYSRIPSLKQLSTAACPSPPCTNSLARHRIASLPTVSSSCSSHSSYAPPYIPSKHSIPSHTYATTSLGLILRRLGLSPRRILQQRRIHRATRQMNISHHRSTDKHVFCRTLRVASAPTSTAPTQGIAAAILRTKCGHRISSTASALSSLILRY
jgi:hypothetical protein